MRVLGIIAGKGQLPAQLIEACQQSGRDFFVLGFENSADPETIAHVPHAMVRIGAVGEALAHLKNAGVQDIVMAGNIKRPSFLSLRPDAVGTRLMARMGSAIFSGDDALLKALVSFLEDEGFKVVGSDEIIGGLLMPAGILSKTKPDKRASEDIQQGLRIARAIGGLDIGQAVIIENGYVLGVEAAEGTDALIQRCGNLRRDMRSGVLVKVNKPGQEARVDLPAIGPVTVEQAHAAGLAGIAVEAGASLILDREKTIAKADMLGIFVVGMQDDNITDHTYTSGL
jgi:DUF1009 family protein